MGLIILVYKRVFSQIQGKAGVLEQVHVHVCASSHKNVHKHTHARTLMCTHTHTHTHTHIHTHTYTHTQAHTCTSTHSHQHTNMHTLTHLHTQTHAQMCINRVNILFPCVEWISNISKHVMITFLVPLWAFVFCCRLCLPGFVLAPFYLSTSHCVHAILLLDCFTPTIVYNQSLCLHVVNVLGDSQGV